MNKATPLDLTSFTPKSNKGTNILTNRQTLSNAIMTNSNKKKNESGYIDPFANLSVPEKKREEKKKNMSSNSNNKDMTFINLTDDENAPFVIKEEDTQKLESFLK